MLRRRLLHDNRGDTIVEVLIAISVISAMLMAAFSSIRHISANVQDTKDHAQALHLLEGQVEQLRTAASADDASTTGIFGSGGASSFCLVGAVPTPSSNASCKKQGLGSLFDLSIVRSAAPNQNTFTATVKWTGLNYTNAQEQIVYKVYP